MDDSQIVKLFLERSEQAIAELSDKYGARCRRIAENVLGDREDAEECVNDAYLAVWNTVPPQRPDPLFTYLGRIVRNLAIKRYHANTAKKRNGVYDAALDEIADCIPSPGSVGEELDARETARSVNRFLSGLDRESRILFVRRYWYADSIDELAALFHTGKHNVSVRLSRLRKKLKKHLLKEGVPL